MASILNEIFSGGDGYVPTHYQYDETELARQRAAQEQSRASQDYIAGKYRDRVEGKSPSIAEAQLRQGLNQAQASQMSQARSATGGAMQRNVAGYQAAQNAAQIQGAGAASAAQLRAQEQAQAEAGLAGLYSDMRSQDQGMFGAEAGYQQGKAQNWAQIEGAHAQQSEQAASRRQQGSGGAMAAGSAAIGAMAMMSDRRAKEDVRPMSDDEIEAFLEAAEGARYEYKRGAGRDGEEHFGPMAQELERSRVGRSFVDEGPDGMRRVDTVMGYGAALAALHQLHQRLKRVEGRE